MYNNKACHGISDNLVNLKYTYTEYRRFLWLIIVIFFMLPPVHIDLIL
jgi:hypothetical protein